MERSGAVYYSRIGGDMSDKESKIIYPCECEDMMWMVDNNKVFKKENDRWVLRWTELDKHDKGTNIETFGVRFSNCLFCGKKIKG